MADNYQIWELLFLKLKKIGAGSLLSKKEYFDPFGHPAIVNFNLDIFFIVFALIILYFVFKNLPSSYGLYMLATMVVALSTGTFMSIGRYIFILFSIYILLASTKNQYLEQSWAFIYLFLFGFLYHFVGQQLLGWLRLWKDLNF